MFNFELGKRLLTQSPDAGRGRVANPTSSRGCGTTKGARKGRGGVGEDCNQLSARKKSRIKALKALVCKAERGMIL